MSNTHRLTLPELLLGAVKVKVHVEALHKLGDGVLVGVRLLEGGEGEPTVSHVRLSSISEHLRQQPFGLCLTHSFNYHVVWCFSGLNGQSKALTINHT